MHIGTSCRNWQVWAHVAIKVSTTLFTFRRLRGVGAWLYSDRQSCLSNQIVLGIPLRWPFQCLWGRRWLFQSLLDHNLLVLSLLPTAAAIVACYCEWVNRWLCMQLLLLDGLSWEDLLLLFRRWVLVASDHVSIGAHLLNTIGTSYLISILIQASVSLRDWVFSQVWDLWWATIDFATELVLLLLYCGTWRLANLYNLSRFTLLHILKCEPRRLFT